MRIVVILIIMLSQAGIAIAGGHAIEYRVDGKIYEGYYISPKDNAPLVILLHDWDGLTEYEVKRAEMLAGEGYAVFAADLFGKGVRPTEVTDKRQHTGELYNDRVKMRRLIGAAIDAATGQGGDPDRAVMMGYCFGGAAVLEYARSGASLKGYATFHGGLATPEGQDYSKARGPLLIMHGTADASITMDDFAALAVELERWGAAHEMITYGGAPHAFTVFGGDRYRQDADQKSWERFLGFLAARLQ